MTGSATPSVLPFRKPRHFRAEAVTAQGNLFEKMLVHRQEVTDLREGKPHKLIMIANSLVLCGLPYRPTESMEVVRTAKTGSGRTRVTFYALGKDAEGKRIPMARGTDRTYLHWAGDRAIKLQSPFVPFDSVKEFFDDMGISTAGKNYAALRDTQQRLSGLSIVVERFSTTEDRGIMTVFEKSRLPRSLAPNLTPIDGPCGLRFSDAYFKELKSRPVPFLLPLLRTLSKKPQMQDFALFLHHRSYAAQKESRIPWSMLREQLWQEDRTPERIRVRMDEAIELLKTVWPELNASTEPDATTGQHGLLIGPPRDGQHLIPEHHAKQF